MKKIFIKNKNSIYIISIILTIILVLSLVSPCYAATASPSTKEEVVYTNLNADGSVNSIYVVNILKGDGEILDYGNYSTIRNMSTSEDLNLNNGVITGKTTVEKLYYEGILDEANLPWNISVKYFLNGKEYTASEIAGKDGAFELRINIKQNPLCDSIFFDNYALQVSITLDTKLCSNIKTNDATIANVGSNKQLTYTILPGNEKDIAITADVTDFRMDGISLNGVQLNLGIDLDDEELLDQVNDLSSGIVQVDDGVNELKKGTEEVKNAVKDDLMNGVSSLQSGTTTLDNGIITLQNGINEAQTGLNQLNENSSELVTGSAQVKNALLEIQSALSAISITTDKLSELTAASSQIKSGINDLSIGIENLQNNIGYAQYKAVMSANGLDVDTLIAGNTQAISDLSILISSLEQTINSLPESEEFAAQKIQLQNQIAQLSTIITLLNGNNAAIGGTETYLNQLSGALDSLYIGINELNAKYNEFDVAISGLTDTLAGLLVNVSTLSNGINELVAQYEKLDYGIKEYTDGVATLATGYSQIINGVNSLADGSKELSNGISSLYSGTNDLYDGVSQLYDGTINLSDGTGEMREQTDGLDTEISDKVDTLLNSVSGNNSEIVSFVSDKNTSIQSVQFVIQMDALEKIETKEDVSVEEKKPNFIEKLKDLFS